jgi:hypothetical protein
MYARCNTCGVMSIRVLISFYFSRILTMQSNGCCCCAVLSCVMLCKAQVKYLSGESICMDGWRLLSIAGCKHVFS